MPRINHNGYVEIYMPAHHRARGNGYVFEHIIALEKKIGRKLESNEQTHHVDGNKQNNDPANLEVVDIREHQLITARERRFKNMANCYGCGVEIYRKPSRKKERNFCSRSCSVKKQQRGERGHYI